MVIDKSNIIMCIMSVILKGSSWKYLQQLVKSNSSTCLRSPGNNCKGMWSLIKVISVEVCCH